jgi:uncharacterized protein with HEPN domain
MLDYGREVVTFIQRKDRKSLDDDLLLARGLAMSTGIIGEAASHVSLEVRTAYPEIPWRSIVAMRNFLIHEYMNHDLDLLWDTATKSVPILIDQLEKILGSLGSDETSNE